MLFGFELFGAPAAIVQPVEQHKLDQIAALARAYEQALNESNGNEREAVFALLMQLRSEIQGPAYKGPRARAHRISNKDRGRLRRALDKIVQEGRAA